MQNKKKLLIVINSSDFFISHRLPVALEALKYYEIHVLYPNNNSDKNKIKISNYGFITHEFFMKNYSLNPFFEFITIINLFWLIRKIKPTYLHLYTIKPILYCSIFSYFNKRIKKVLISFTGLGMLQYTKNIFLKVIKFFIYRIYKLIFSSSKFKFIFQNNDDLDYFKNLKILGDNRAYVIPGSGVDCSKFIPLKTNIRKKSITVLMASRILWAKGVFEFVESSKRFLSINKDVNFILAGSLSQKKSFGPSKNYLELLKNQPNIIWLGYQSNVLDLIHASDIICLPSKYGEGVPKFLIEGAMCGKPLISTNVNGISEVLKHNYNGILIKPNSVSSLVTALKKMSDDKKLRLKMGANSRALAENKFDEKIIIANTIKIYKNFYR